MTYSIEQMAQLAKKFEKMGWNAECVTSLGQANEGIYWAIKQLLEGKTIQEVDIASRGRRAFETRKKKSLATVTPAVSLVTSPAGNGLEVLWVDSDLQRLVNLDLCDDDERPLQPLFTLPRNMNDSAIAEHLDGLASLTTRKATLGQLVREVNLARSGQKGLFKKGRYYLLYLEGSDGSLVAVSVCWRAGRSRWGVICFRFGQLGEWREGRGVYGN